MFLSHLLKYYLLMDLLTLLEGGALTCPLTWNLSPLQEVLKCAETLTLPDIIQLLYYILYTRYF